MTDHVSQMSIWSWIFLVAGAALTVGGIWLFVKQTLLEHQEETTDDDGPMLFGANLIEGFMLVIGIFMILGALGVIGKGTI